MTIKVFFNKIRVGKSKFYILKESFRLTKIQTPKYTSQISRFCLYFSVKVCLYISVIQQHTLSLNPKLCVVIIYQCGKFVSRGGNIGRAILMLSIYLLLNFRNLRRAITHKYLAIFQAIGLNFAPDGILT